MCLTKTVSALAERAIDGPMSNNSPKLGGTSVFNAAVNVKRIDLAAKSAFEWNEGEAG